jgi:hypothetical protein
MQEVALLRVRLGEKDASSRMKDLCIRMVYCEMLGHPVEFGYIHAVNMTQHNALGEKKLGYLAASLFLDDSSELLILLVNTLQVLAPSPSPQAQTLKQPRAKETIIGSLHPRASTPKPLTKETIIGSLHPRASTLSL